MMLTRLRCSRCGGPGFLENAMGVEGGLAVFCGACGHRVYLDTTGGRIARYTPPVWRSGLCEPSMPGERKRGHAA